MQLLLAPWTHRHCISNCQEVLNFLAEPNSPFCCQNCNLDSFIDDFRKLRLQSSSIANTDVNLTPNADHELSDLKNQVSTLITTIQPLLKSFILSVGKSSPDHNYIIK